MDATDSNLVAIVGMSCHFPGDTNSPGELWSLLMAGGDTHSLMPPTKMNVDSFYHPDKTRPGSIPMKSGYFLSEERNPNDFDPSFFGINAQEACSMDPAQKLLLQSVYEAFESAGLTLEKLDGSETGVWVGNMNADHATNLAKDPEYAPAPYGATGGDPAILSNRVNYVFNLKGPSLTINTACSSSMYAVSLAEAALQRGECDMAVVAGTNIILAPEMFLLSSKLGALGPSGRCNTFDERADGYGRAEGVGVLVLKRLGKAIQDNDPIRAVIRATALNSNGRSSGITHPSSEGQSRAIRAAYRKAGLDTRDTGYFEVHGTGTPVGDPIEVASITKVFAGQRRRDNQPLLIGAMKPNIGHTEGASGIASIIKAVLILETGIIPPTINIKKLNRAIDFAQANIHVVTESRSLPEFTPGLRRVSVNSFGYGGSNAHIILDGIRIPAPTSQGKGSRHDLAVPPKQLLVFSAHHKVSIQKNIENIRAVAHKYSGLDLAMTLAKGRTYFPERGYTFLENNCFKSNCRMGLASPGKVEVYFLFTGQGTNWAGMGSAFMKFNTFSRSIQILESVLDEIGAAFRLKEVLCSLGEEKVHDPLYSQPMSTAFQIALVDQLEEWGVSPIGVIGHSSGELAAAYAAGYISASDAIIISYLRGRIVSEQNNNHGAMIAVGLGAEPTREYLEKNLSKASCTAISFAAFNSPSSVTLSGGHKEINELSQKLNQDHIFNQILETNGNAYHSGHMQVFGVEYELTVDTALASQARRRSSLHKKEKKPMFSSVTGELLAGNKQLSANYWRQNLENPVLFHQALEGCLSGLNPDKSYVFIEVGPRSALRNPFKQVLSASSATPHKTQYISAVKRGEDSSTNALTLAGELFLIGASVNIDKINLAVGADDVHRKIIVDLPSYSWNNQIYQHTSKASEDWRFRRFPRHDILGSMVPGGPSDGTGAVLEWRNHLSLKYLPWLQDHKVCDEIVFPAAGFLCQAIEALQQLQSSPVTNCTLRDIEIPVALIIPNTEREVLLFVHMWRESIRPRSSSAEEWFRFSVSSELSKSSATVTHCRGRIKKGTLISEDIVALTLPDVTHGPDEAPTQLSAKKLYEKLDATGLSYGPTFRCLGDLKLSSERKLAHGAMNLRPLITGFPSGNESRYLVHPAVLDAGLQIALAATFNDQRSRTLVPVKVRKLVVNASEATTGYARAQSMRFKDEETDTYQVSSSIHTQNAFKIAEFRDIHFAQYVSTSKVQESDDEQWEPLSHIIWKPSFTLINSDQTSVAFPPATDDRISTLWRSLDHLTQYYLEDIFDRNGVSIAQFQPKSVDLQRLISWMKHTVEFSRAHEPDLSSYPPELRDGSKATVLQYLREQLEPLSIEARIIIRIAENLPAILREEIQGISLLREGMLQELYDTDSAVSAVYAQLGRAMDLLAHENPNSRIIEVGAGTGGATRRILSILSPKGSPRRFQTYLFTDISPGFLSPASEMFAEYDGIEYRTFDMESSLESQSAESLHGKFDIILASQVIHATSEIVSTLRRIRRLLVPGGRLVLVEVTKQRLFYGLMLGTFSGYWKGADDGRPDGPFLSKAQWHTCLRDSGFETAVFLDDFDSNEASSSSVIVATARRDWMMDGPETPGTDVMDYSIIYLKEPTAFSALLKQRLERSGYKPSLTALDSVTPDQLQETRALVIAELEDAVFFDMKEEYMVGIKRIVSHCSSVLWITNGRLLAHHDPKHAMAAGFFRSVNKEVLKPLYTLDLDLDIRNADSILLGNIVGDILRYAEVLSSTPGLYDVELRQGEDGLIYTSRIAISYKQLAQVKTLPLGQQRPFSVVSSPGAILFREESLAAVHNTGLTAGIELIEVWNDGSREALSVCAGFVSYAGPGVTRFRIGDYVLFLQTTKLGNYVTTDESRCMKIERTESLPEIINMTRWYCAILFALEHVARIHSGEKVLLIWPNNKFARAAYHTCVTYGAQVYAIVETEEVKHYVRTVCGFEPQRILHASGLGSEDIVFDIVLNFAQDEDIFQWAANSLAPYGRLLDLSGHTVSRRRRQSYAPSLRPNTSFFLVDLEAALDSEPSLGERLLQKAHLLLGEWKERVGLIDEAEVNDIGRVRKSEFTERGPGHWNLISLEDRSSLVSVHGVARVNVGKKIFEKDATYLLVGGLGGLGRSLSRWMVANGARSLVYLSRTGKKNQEAQSMISEFLRTGVAVTVVEGDVTSPSAVGKAIDSAPSKLRGLFQCAMVLKNCMLEGSTSQDFRAATVPKVQGTLNLHLASLKHDLEFFLCLSSLVSAVGMQGQANYCAANNYQDALCQQRRAMGLPATSLLLGMITEVGTVSEDEVARKSLERNGFYPIPEKEFLAMVNRALSNSGPATNDTHSISLTGMEPSKIQQLVRGVGVDPTWIHEPRFSSLLRFVSGANNENGSGETVHQTLNGSETLQSIIAGRIARLLFMNGEDMRMDQPLSTYGLDSMIAAELRAWLSKTWNIDITFPELIAKSTTISTLCQRIEARSDSNSHTLPMSAQVQ